MTKEHIKTKSWYVFKFKNPRKNYPPAVYVTGVNKSGCGYFDRNNRNGTMPSEELNSCFNLISNQEAAKKIIDELKNESGKNLKEALWKLVERKCVICGATIPPHKHADSKTCSDECSRKLTRFNEKLKFRKSAKTQTMDDAAPPAPEQSLVKLEQPIHTSCVDTVAEERTIAIEVIPQEDPDEIVKRLERCMFIYRGEPCAVAKAFGNAIAPGYGETFVDSLIRKWANETKEGEDYIVVSGQELSELKELLPTGQEHSIDRKAPKIALVLEDGMYLGLMKSEKPAAIPARKQFKQIIKKFRKDSIDIDHHAQHDMVQYDPAAAKAEISLKEKKYDDERREREAKYTIEFSEVLKKAGFSDNQVTTMLLRGWGKLSNEPVSHLLPAHDGYCQLYEIIKEDGYKMSDYQAGHFIKHLNLKGPKGNGIPGYSSKHRDTKKYTVGDCDVYRYRKDVIRPWLREADDKLRNNNKIKTGDIVASLKPRQIEECVRICMEVAQNDKQFSEDLNNPIESQREHFTNILFIINGNGSSQTGLFDNNKKVA